MRKLVHIVKATYVVAFLFLCSRFVYPGPDSARVPSADEEFRGLWVIRNNLSEKASIDRVIRFAQNYGFRQLLLQVRGRGDAYYQSSLVPKYPPLVDKDFDPLKYAVTKAHEVGLEVHAWVNVYLLWTSSNMPEQQQHLLHRHPEWTDADFSGRMNLQTDWTESRHGNGGGIYLAPTHPEVNPYMLQIIQELVDQYEIDGIHLDYIRYRGAQYGFNPSGRKLFLHRYGVDPLNIGEQQNSTDSPWDDLTSRTYTRIWQKYRQDRVTDFVRRAKRLCDANGIQLSAAVKPIPEQARKLYFQDWVSWMEEDLLHFVIPMNYTTRPDDFLQNLAIIKGAADTANVVMGIAVYNQPVTAAAEKLLRTREHAFSGVCFFSYNTFQEYPGYIETLKNYFAPDDY